MHEPNSTSQHESMTAVAFTVEQYPDGTVVTQMSGNFDTGTELEKRLAGCLHRAVSAAMDEVLAKYQNGITITKESISAKAQAVCRAALEQDGRIG
jgi:hypothetical protein